MTDDEIDEAIRAADDRYSRLAGWYGDECKRREDAEALLRGVLETWPHLTPIADHFARYKD